MHDHLNVSLLNDKPYPSHIPNTNTDPEPSNDQTHTVDDGLVIFAKKNNRNTKMCFM